MTSDLRRSLAEHNAGRSASTADHMPWRLVTYLAFSSPSGAAKFERYLNSGSGQTFAGRRLWTTALDPVERFRRQVCSSAFMKSELRRTQRDLCAVCGMPLWKRRVVIHHMDYAHRCDWAGTLHARVAGKEVEVPDCEDCRRHDADRFARCHARLLLLHQGCHADHHAGRRTIGGPV